MALGGSGYAAIQIAHPAAKHKKSKAPSRQALIGAAVAKYFNAHHGQFVGPAGQAGATGPAAARTRRQRAGDTSRLRGGTGWADFAAKPSFATFTAFAV